MLRHKQQTGSVTGFKHGDTIEGDDLIGVECEVLAPAALEESLRVDNAERVREPSSWRSRTTPRRPMPTACCTIAASG